MKFVYAILGALFLMTGQELSASPKEEASLWAARGTAIQNLKRERWILAAKRSFNFSVASASFFALGRHYNLMGGVVASFDSESQTLIEPLARITLMTASLWTAQKMNQYLEKEYKLEWLPRTLGAASVGLAVGLSTPNALHFCYHTLSQLAQSAGQ